MVGVLDAADVIGAVSVMLALNVDRAPPAIHGIVAKDKLKAVVSKA